MSPTPPPRRIDRRPLLDRIFNPWFYILASVLAVGTAVCGVFGYLKERSAPTVPVATDESKPAAKKDDPTIPLFKAAQLFPLNSGTEEDVEHPENVWLPAARVFALAFFGLLSVTALIKACEAVYYWASEKTRTGHVVVCGLGNIGLHILDDLLGPTAPTDRPPGGVVVLEANEKNPWLDYARQHGATVLVSDATRPSTLLMARAQHAAQVYLVTGDDGANLEVAAELVRLVQAEPAEGRVVRAFAHISDINLSATILQYASTLHAVAGADVHTFNVPRSAAVRLVTTQLWEHAPQATDEVAHYVLFGFGAMGQALAAQLARLAHFPNRKRCRFTIVDADIRRLAGQFIARFPRFTRWAIVDGTRTYGVTGFDSAADEWRGTRDGVPDELGEKHDVAVEFVANARFEEAPPAAGDPLFVTRLAAELKQTGVKPVLFVCGQTDRENFEAAVQLEAGLEANGLTKTPIFVWLPRQPALAEALRTHPDRQFIPFGECREAVTLAEIIRPLRERLGETFHHFYEKLYGSPGKPWAEVAEVFRESNRQAADHLPIKLAHLTFRLTLPGEHPSTANLTPTAGQMAVLAEMEHNRWVAERLMSGWQYVPKGTDAEVKANKALKRNHNLVAWANVDPAEKEKDKKQIEALVQACKDDTFAVVPLV